MLPDEKTSVRVAVRVRPMSTREQAVDDVGLPRRACLSIPTEDQVVIGTERAFTFDYTFNSESLQEDVFTATTRDLVDGCFEGLNATILAYGQTGSGKTFTMGTGFDVATSPESLGIVPRAVDHMFYVMQTKHEESVDQERASPQFDVTVQFVELYQDELVDLLDRATGSARGKKSKAPRLGEDNKGNVILNNVCKKSVASRDEILDWLKKGALSRTTGSTNMNAQSSRSHAIFTIEIKQTIPQPNEDDSTTGFLTTNAKFHFVDLAGSERLKRTKAVGDRQREGISINTCLLALGNVISKLGDKSLKAKHIPYRESKLTRLLQDSLGGNSRTVMIACVSPAQEDFMESLTTLKYANRARNIQNKVVSNQDTTGQTICTLRSRILELEMQILEFQQGKREPGVEAYNDMFLENNHLQAENESLKQRLNQANETKNRIAEELIDREKRNAELRAENDRLKESHGGIENDVEMGSNPNLTDQDKLRIHHAVIVEALETQLRKANHEILQLNHHKTSDSPYASPRRISSAPGNKTHRMASRRTYVMSPAGNLDNLSGDSVHLPIFPGSPLISGMDLDVERLALAEMDEEIRVKEEEMEAECERMKIQMDAERESYESKIAQLQTRISEVEQEQKSHFMESKSKKGVDLEKTKERDIKYQRELEDLRRQLKEQRDLHSDYKRLQTDNTTQSKKLSKLGEEIAGMKRMRCEAVKKSEQESKRARIKDQEQTRNYSNREKELRSVKKQLAERDSSIQQLQYKIARYQAEILVAKRPTKNVFMSDKVAGRVGRRSPTENDIKKNWDEFLKYFNAVAYKRMRLRNFEKQLLAYRAELTNLRLAAKEAERNLTLFVEKQDMSAVDVWRSTLDDTRSTIRFIEQKESETQNEAAVCDESQDEYNNIDPVYISMKFPDEVSNRFFINQMLDTAMNQREDLMLQESKAQVKAAEHEILVKERTVLREILQFYMTDNPNQAKVDIADVARKNLEDNGVTDLSSDDVLRNIFATPLPPMKLSSHTKARQMTLNGPGDMLIGKSGSSGSSSVSTPSTSRGSVEDDRTSSYGHQLGVDSFPATLRTCMPPPKYVMVNTVRKDLKRSKAGKSGLTNLPPISVLGFSIPSSPLRTPNRSVSLMEISEQGNHRYVHQTIPSHANSLENIKPHPFPVPQLVRTHRQACQSQLNKVPPASPSRR